MWRSLLQWISAKRPGQSGLEIHVPISPHERFFTMVHYLAASLRLHGGRLADSRMVVTVGADQEPYEVGRRLPWTKNYDLEFRWLDRARYREHSYFATALERFRHRFEAPAVLLMDADMFLTGSIEDAVAEVIRDQVFAGALARVSPFADLPNPSSQYWWGRLCEQAGLGPPNLSCEHPAWGVTYHHPDAQFCIPYFNLGFLLAPAALMRRIGEHVYSDMKHCDCILETHFRCQIAVALALKRLGVKPLLLPLRYNFSNNPDLAEHYAEELRQVRVFHYLRGGEIDRQRDFANVASVDRLIKSNSVTGVNRQVVDALRPIHDVVCHDLGWRAPAAAA